MLENRPHTRQRLTDETVAWLTTVSAQGRPSTAPVWFLLDGDSIVVFSRDPSVRVANVMANPWVTLALNSDPRGADIVVVNGSATVDRSIPPVIDHRTYLDKYETVMGEYGWTAGWFTEQYPTAIRIDITSVRGR
ncbi:MAG: pyridoxamine 5'-phosphate oxidase family protein [Acidimicrobiia bacterium]|nr:pyridoxamine 5'-phosphate oxidase family protein [Acidimicrobiia bacterium]